MAIDAFLEALNSLLTMHHLLFLAAGVFLGIIVGILPGLGGIVGFSVLLPFLYGMETTSALAMLIGLIAVVPTSDTFTSVLMGIPGSSASQATVLDGYPLSKQGQAARALGAAFSSSLIGGLLGAVILTFFILFARTFILKLATAELFMLGVLGLSMIGVLSGNNIFKGFLACGVGLLMGSIGSAPATGEWRLTFGSYYLYDGIKLVIVGLGIFALPEIVELLVQNKRISSKSVLGSGWRQGLKDSWMYKWIIARCAPIGAMIGAIPGLGGSVVDWIAYGHVVQTAKDKSKFGKGDIRGVIAPESANNAKEGGGLIPTLLFGIPGSGSMAIFLGGLTILGIEVGPNLVNEQLNISYTIIWSLALANVIGAGTCLLISGQVARLTTIPYGFLAPFMILVITFAAFQASRSLGDLLMLLGVGVIGIVFKYYDWSRPALLIGFVLSDTVETYFYQAMQFYSWSFLERPGVIIIGSVLVISLFMGNFLNHKKGKLSRVGVDAVKEKLAKVSVSSPSYSFWSGELIFVLCLMVLAIYTIVETNAFEILGGIFPLSIAVVMIILAIPLVIQLTSKKYQSSVLTKAVKINGKWDDLWLDTWKNFLWFIGLAICTWLLGFKIALPLLFIIIMRVKAKAGWFKIALITIIIIGIFLTIVEIMVLQLPLGILTNF